MTQTEFAEALEAQRRQHAVRRQCDVLAEMLALEAHLQPEARQLVPIIGRPSDRTNLKALRSWIARELARCDVSGIDLLDYLYARLAGTAER